MKKLLLVGLVLAGCRTEISPVVKTEAAPAKLRARSPEECAVNDYSASTDVPTNSKSLGLVKVARQATDDATFELLRKKVCELGGDALSQMHWIRASGASVADPPVELEGHAWATP